MENSVARYLVKHAEGWIDWNDISNKPNWQNGKIILDGKFSADELIALIELQK